MAQIVIDPENCKGCYLCKSVCPKQAITKSKKLNAKGYYPAMAAEDRACTGCESCMIICPDMAIEVYDED